MVSDAVDSERMLTIAEVADLIRVSKLATYRLVENGQLPVQRVGKSLRVPGSGLQAYLDTLGRAEPPVVRSTRSPGQPASGTR